MDGEPEGSGPHARDQGLGFGNNYFTEMCSGSEAGSYLRLIDFLYHPTLGLRVIKKKFGLRVHHELDPLAENGDEFDELARLGCGFEDPV